MIIAVNLTYISLSLSIFKLIEVQVVNNGTKIAKSCPKY
jgi:hypothetical protein